MYGYVVRRGNQVRRTRPLTGRERRHWHPAGADRAEAEQLASKLAADRARDRSPGAPA